MLKYHKIVVCSFCGKSFYKYAGHIKENLKLGHNFYCSLKCQYKYKTKKQKLECENCGKQFLRAPHAISPHNYCSQSCAAIVNNKKCLKGHAKIKPKLKTCVKCGKQFRKNTGNKKYCSIKCRREAEWRTPEDLLNIIKNVAQKLKRVPARREVSGIDKSCKRFFGSWNNAIKAAGFIPNRSHDDRMYKRANAKAIDGHLCDSISELLIDNWLTKNNISHEKNVPYPKTNHRADWGINLKGRIIFIEYFGLANDSPRYDRAVKEKRELCGKHKISLISIYPKDLYPKNFLEDNLKEKFKNFLNG